MSLPAPSVFVSSQATSWRGDLLSSYGARSVSGKRPPHKTRMRNISASTVSPRPTTRSPPQSTGSRASIPASHSEASHAIAEQIESDS